MKKFISEIFYLFQISLFRFVDLKIQNKLKSLCLLRWSFQNICMRDIQERHFPLFQKKLCKWINKKNSILLFYSKDWWTRISKSFPIEILFVFARILKNLKAFIRFYYSRISCNKSLFIKLNSLFPNQNKLLISS